MTFCRCLLAGLLLLVAPAFPQSPPPWFTGPLLTPSGHVVPGGMIDIEPYFFYTTTSGAYNSEWDRIDATDFYTVNFQVPIYIGLTKWMDILISPQASWNKTQNVSSLVLGDTTVSLEFQIIEDTEKNTLPGIKVYVQELFPTGHYDRRDQEKLGTDIGGGGSFVTNFGYVITRTFHIYCDHYLALRFNQVYGIPSNVKVHGINAYGGAPATDGCVKVGHFWQTFFGAEYSLTRNWALACDLYAEYKFKTKFDGNSGIAKDGAPAVVGNPESWQFSVAPAIEYNFSASFGIIGGVWFTFAGKNSPSFFSGAIAINYFGPSPISEKNKYRTKGGGAGP